MGADCLCCRNKRKGCESAVLGRKLLRSVESHNNSSRSKYKKPIIRTFNFNSDIVPKNNLKGKDLNLTSFYKVDLIKPLKRIHRFDFSELRKNLGLSEGAYKIATELYGKHWADKLKQEADKITELDDALINLNSSLNLDDIKSVKSTPIKSTLTELQTQVSELPKEISFNLKENGDIDEQDIDTLIDALNKKDQGTITNDPYVYPYGDEPITNESEDRAIKDWIHKMMLRFSTDDDKRLNLIMVIAEIIMSAWKTDKSLYRIMYGFYLAKDLYKIGVFFKFNHYELIKCINGIIGMDIDWNKFNQEALVLNNGIGFGSLIWKQLKALDTNKDLSYKEIKSETENILMEIDKWSESVKIPLDQI